MNSQHFLQSMLARQCWIDGRADGINGMRAVAHTWRNRVTAGWWSSDWSQLLSHANDYAATLPTEQATEVPDPRGFAFQTLLQEIDGIFSGNISDNITIKQDGGFIGDAGIRVPGITPVALYYGRLDQITNLWFLENIARSADHKRVAQVGTMTFFS